MASFWIRSLLLLLCSTLPILGQTLVEPGKSFVWQGIEIQVPEPSITKEENTQVSKLVIYPAKGDGYFFVFRTLPWPIPVDPKNLGLGGLFSKSLEPKLVLKTWRGKQVWVEFASQIRNQNPLQAEIWLLPQTETGIWVWVQWKADRKDLVSFFTESLFLR